MNLQRLATHFPVLKDLLTMHNHSLPLIFKCSDEDITASSIFVFWALGVRS